MEITVYKPTATLREAFMAMLNDYSLHDPGTGELYASARWNFDAYVQSSLNHESGFDLHPRFVPCSHRWLVQKDKTEDKTIVGIVRVRHNLDTPFMETQAGHIGYEVPPSQRKRGYGIESLKAGLTVAWEIGLERVLLCADAKNPASWRTIEHCGGMLEREFWSDHHQCLVRRYWIEKPATLNSGIP